MYESPIELIYKETFPTLVKQQEDLIMRGCIDIGVHIDKEELIKALQYDREQYQKGYKDGKPKNGKWKNFIDDGYVECPFCGHATTCECSEAMKDLHFCFYCGADMRSDEECTDKKSW